MKEKILLKAKKYAEEAKKLVSNAKVHLYIKWIGPHAEYNRLCINNKQYTIEDY